MARGSRICERPVGLRACRPRHSRRGRALVAYSAPPKEQELLEQEFEKSIDAEGAGATWSSPGWLTQLNQLWGGKSVRPLHNIFLRCTQLARERVARICTQHLADAPVANAKPEDIQELLGGALFKALYKWMEQDGSIYLLPTGPVSSFLVVCDPAAAKHVLQLSDNPKNNVYSKGLVAEVSEFLFGSGFATAGGENWRVRRRAVGPGLHRAYLNQMLDKTFGHSALQLNSKLADTAKAGTAIDIEACFSQLTLDVIGRAVFNYDFDALRKDSPVIQAVYTALKETEQRATDLLPLWKLPGGRYFLPRQRAACEAVDIIRATTEELVARCKEMVDEEEQAKADGNEEYLNEADPSILRFLIASRDVASAEQLRDDLLGMLVAGHETTASVLTWTVYLLCQNPEAMRKVQEEVDRVLGDSSTPNMEQYKELKYTMRCINESMRLYPHPPVLLRRALREDTLPNGLTVPKGQDVMLAIYNIHRSPAVWDDPHEFKPERFPLDKPIPTETNTDFRFIPFSGGPRKCVGDQFALMEAVVSLAVVLKRFDVDMVPDQDPGMTTGATIHTINGLFVTVKERSAVVSA